MLTEIPCNEIERQKVLEKELYCMFIRINPDGKYFNISKGTNNIHSYIKKSTKKSLIDDLSKRLLESEFKSNHSIKSKCLKWIVKKYYQQYKSLCKQKSYIVAIKQAIKNKTNKNWKRTWNKVLFKVQRLHS